VDREFNSNLSPTALVNELIDDLMFLSENMIFPKHQRIIRKFCDIILNNRTAVSDTTNLLPLETALFVIQVMEHEDTNYEISEVHNRMDTLNKRLDELEQKIQELRNLLNEKT